MIQQSGREMEFFGVPNGRRPFPDRLCPLVLPESETFPIAILDHANCGNVSGRLFWSMFCPRKGAHNSSRR